MPRVTGVIGTAIIAVLLLTGCTAPTVGEPTKNEAVVETVAPLVAETPDAAETGDAAFLTAVREALPADTQIPNATDEQLLAAGQRACDEIAAGADTLTLSLVKGETANGAGYFQDSAVIIGEARRSLCI